MTKLRMKAIWYGADFRKSDMRLYTDFACSDEFPGPLKGGECYLFVSANENQLIWFLQQECDRHGDVEFTDTRRWRFPFGTRWEPDRVRHYAQLAGIELTGMRTFGQLAKDFREDVRERRRESSRRCYHRAREERGQW